MEIKIWGCGRVIIKNGWVGWFHPVEWSKFKMVKLGVCRPQNPPITTYLFPNSNIIDTVRLPLISGENTHSWGKITVKKN